jgi:dolichyl-phosphate-mannose--protein O-mannosyl transferase
MQIDKRDFTTVSILSICFFILAAYNLGSVSVPLNAYKPSRGESFYIDFGCAEKISAVYFLLKRGEVDLKFYTGSPGNWTGGLPASTGGYYYYSWWRVDVNCETRFLKFVFDISTAEIVEISALNFEGEKVVLNTVRDESGDNEALTSLIDEQEKVECPPSHMCETYFDEVYYVRAAEDYINLKEPFEWTHPPLGKLIITASILVFGYNPFGWRIVGVIFATLIIPVIYFFGKKMFNTWIGGFASGFLLTFDFMHFTMGRIATVDTYLVFFSLTSHIFFFMYVKRVLEEGWKASRLPLFLAVLFFSLGFSTKWFTIFGFAGQVFILLLLRVKTLFEIKNGLAEKFKAFFSRPFFSFIGFCLIAILIYFLTYVPHFFIGYDLNDIYNLQLSMLTFHSTLTATHPYSSPWYSWPFIFRPVLFYYSNIPNGLVSSIAAMGNPAVWWFGFAFLVCSVEEALRRGDNVCKFISAIFFFQWLPYIFISRCLFIYHFYSNVPFLIFATVYFLNKSWARRRGKIAWSLYLILTMALFALFYPVISGFPAPIWWHEILKWSRGWVF